jgi:hypothetical protein
VQRWLKYKLQQYGVSGRMFNWISQYLHNRKARAGLNGYRSRKKLLKEGLPQGGVRSTTLFLIFTDDIIMELP